jgi:trehalose 6-phosphate synthase
VQYLRQSLPHEELVALYLAADVMMVTPVRDGMNLIAKEYVASRTEEDGTLVLSECTGAANELREALIVNPHDLDGIVGALHAAIRMDPDEQRQRMRAMRERVFENDVYAWADGFMRALRGERASVDGGPDAGRIETRSGGSSAARVGGAPG